MPAFTYKAKDRKGQLINGTMDAESRAAVNSRLQAMGYFPISIGGGGGAGEAASAGSKAGGKTGGKVAASLTQMRGGKIKSTDLALFYRQMSDLIGAGIPLVKALNIIKGQMPNPRLTEVLATVSGDVQGGDTFAAALEKHPALFTKLTVALVRAGETGGLLDQTLSRIADFAESQDELKSKIKSAMAYPMIMVFVGVTAVIVLLTFVMPKVMDIFKELDQALPGPTLMLIAISDYLKVYWHITFGIVGAGIFALRRYIKTDKGELAYHNFMLKLPKFGDLILKREIASFTRTLGALLRNGVPILNALTISGEVMTIRPIRNEIAKIPEGITQGAGIAPTLRSSPLFPPVVVNMVAIGEETGHLPEVLLRVAESYETQVDRAIKTLTTFIEPVIILVLGVVVAFIVISMLLPIFSMDPTKGM